MHIKHKTQEIAPGHDTKPYLPLRAAGLAWVILMSTPTFAASIYRCGNVYSDSSVCKEGAAVEIQAHKAAAMPQPSPHKTPSAWNDQKEAEALEQKRLASEHRAVKQTPLRTITASPNKTSGVETPPSTETYPASHRRHSQSPYFTAKDPNAPAKKKGNAKALPSEPN